MANTTFIRITNKDIYEKLEVIEKNIIKINTRTKINSAVISILTLIVIAIIYSL